MKRNSCEIRPNPYSRKETNKTKKLTVFLYPLFKHIITGF